MTRLAITGHRGLSAGTAELVSAALRTEIDKHASTDLIGLSCIADGADTLFAEAILERGATLHVVVPAEKYRDGLPTDHHPIYDALIGQATEVITLDHLESNPTAHMDASRRMIAEADELLAVWDGQPPRGRGGTADVVKAAQDHGLPVTVVWPPGSQRD
jgi:hypothetical protein